MNLPRPAAPEHWNLGLVGYPLGHSRSPAMHTAALHACGLEGEYSLVPVAPDERRGQRFGELVRGLRAGRWQGLNVTIPHKQAILAHLDRLSPAALAIGAANTLVLRSGRLIGENTDAPGFLSGLDASLPDLQARSGAGRTAWVLGAGGSARAVVHALALAGWQLVVAARRSEQALELGAAIPNARLQAAPLDERVLAVLLAHCAPALVVNATPAGMAPLEMACPWPADLPFPTGAAVYDLVYNPSETELVRRARRSGLAASTGLGMLVEQAALAFELWTGLAAPRAIMAAAAAGGRV